MDRRTSKWGNNMSEENKTNLEEFLVERRSYNLPRLKKLKEMIDKGEVLKQKKEVFTDNPIWERHGFVHCIGVHCSIKELSTTYDCPLEQEDCWWVYAHYWRLDFDKKPKKWSIMKRYSDISRGQR